MRQAILAVSLLILTHCSKKENLSLDAEIRRLSSPSQTFNIKNDATDSLVTANGTSIIIPANTLVFNDGQNPNGIIQVEVREVFDRSDMILNGLSTTSKGRLLESYGMIELKATSNGQELRIKDDGFVRLVILNKKKGVEGELFYGQGTDSTLDWQYAGLTKDTTEVIETMQAMSNGLTSVKRTTYRFVNGLREFVSDTLFTIKYDVSADTTAPMEESMEFPKMYEFTITNLGWINCDRFINISDKVDLEIQMKEYSQPIGYLVFADINSVMRVLFDDKGVAVAKDLPRTYMVDLIVLDNIKGDKRWGKQKLELGATKTVSVETFMITENELIKELKRLDK